MRTGVLRRWRNALHLDLLAEAAERAQVAFWSYCLMSNYVHVIAVPGDEDGLRWTFRHVHLHYTGYINARMRVTGYLGQGRFSSVAMDEARLVSALRYVALNPVRPTDPAPEDWRWSSAVAYLAGESGRFVDVMPALERAGNFWTFLVEAFDEAMAYAALRIPRASVARSDRRNGWRIWRFAPGRPSRRASAGRPRRRDRDYCRCHDNTGIRAFFH
jgi:REP element-mobilizing transposase RayT